MERWGDRRKTFTCAVVVLHFPTTHIVNLLPDYNQFFNLGVQKLVICVNGNLLNLALKFSFTNTYLKVVVQQPCTLQMMALGLTGVGFNMCTKRKRSSLLAGAVHEAD